MINALLSYQCLSITHGHAWDLLMMIYLICRIGYQVILMLTRNWGLRKIRVGSKGKVKRGGARVIYVDFVVIETIYLFYVYGKNEQENLTEADKREYKELIAEPKNSLA